MPLANGKPRNGVDKKHPFVRVRRRARLIYLRILRIDDPPERIARGAAIGVLMGILPTFGLGTFLSLAAAFVLKANKAAAVLGSFIMNPITSPAFWTLSMLLGSVLLGEDYSAYMEKIKQEGLLKGAGWAYAAFLLGNAIVSAVFTAASYYIVKGWVTGHRRRKDEKRLKRLERER